MALLALTGYLTVTVWGLDNWMALAVMILSLAYLWEAGVMLMWLTLRSRAALDHAATGTVAFHPRRTPSTNTYAQSPAPGLTQDEEDDADYQQDAADRHQNADAQDPAKISKMRPRTIM